MATPSNVIVIPRASRKAFNKNRPISTLIQTQIRHLHEVEMALPPEQQTGIDISLIKTEGEASDYIRRMTSILHPKAARHGGATTT